MTVALTASFAFGSTWQDDPAGYVWTDEAAHTEAVRVTRGRSSELELFPAGTATIMLDNGARRFDPLNADGPYYGQIVPGVPVRIAVDGEVLFVGFVDGWAHAVGTFKGTVEVPCTDAFKYLANVPLRSVYEYEVLADAPHLYLTLADQTGERAADLSGNRNDMTWSGTPERGVTVRPYAQGGAGFPPGWRTAYVATTKAAAMLTATPFTVEVWLRLDTSGGLTADVAAQGDATGPTSGGDLAVWRIETQAGELLFTLNLDAEARDEVWFTWGADLADGDAHHIVLTVGATPLLYIDGRLFTPFDNGGFGVPYGDLAHISVGALVTTSPRLSSDQRIDASDFAVYVTELTATQVAAHYAAAVAPWDGDRTGARVDRILDLLGWPATARDVDGGEVTCGHANIAGVNALDALQVLERTEGGRAFIGRTGSLVFHDNSRTSLGDPVATIDAVVDETLQLSTDETFLYDAAEVTRVEGTPQYAGAAAPTRVYTATDLVMRDDVSARNRAERVIARYGTVQTRANAFTVPTPDAAALLGLELGDVIAVTLPAPQGEGAALALELYIEQMAWTITPDDYAVTIYGSPTHPRDLFRFAGTTTVGTVNGFDAGVFR